MAKSHEWFRILVRQLRAGKQVNFGGEAVPEWAQEILKAELASSRTSVADVAEAMRKAAENPGRPYVVGEDEVTRG